MTPARMRRLASDYEEVKKNFAGHKNIIVTPIGTDVPEKYHVTYFVNGIYLLPDGTIQTLGRHEVDITLHADYPRYKPICRILTPIWHPNFRDGQICIGDIWGAGESLSDIIVNIGDMIQYKSWNSFSPLCADAAQWAMDNKHLFPVGNVDLFYADYASAKDTVEIDLFGEDEAAAAPTETPAENPAAAEETPAAEPVAAEEAPAEQNSSGNDFDITPEELAGIEFVPSAQRMQTVPHGGKVKGKVNFKTVLTKGILWALLGALVGFGLGELVENEKMSADIMGYSHLGQYYEYNEKGDAEYEAGIKEFRKYCFVNGLDFEDADISLWYYGDDISEEAKEHIDSWLDYEDKAEEAFYDSYLYDFDADETALEKGIVKTTRISTGIWAAITAMCIGLFLGIGEGVYYGSGSKAAIFGLIGAVVSLVLGFFSGDLAQLMYANFIDDASSTAVQSLIRGAGWAIMGLGIGLGIGFIRPSAKRILYCAIGGAIGAFGGGFAFNYICELFTGDVISRAVGIVFMGLLIGIGVGLLEQFAKQAWLKVIRGEFEGKEYLVFSGTTSIGNNGSNTIVLFKDKLVGPHHCDIVLEGSKYVIIDCGTPMGTIVNGNRVGRQILRQGDAIAVGNSVLIFNTK